MVEAAEVAAFDRAAGPDRVARDARQIRPTDDGDSPVLAGRSRVDQCVASVGLSSNVHSSITASTSSSEIDRGAPRTADHPAAPSRPRSMNRLRHFTTVA